MDEGYTSRIVSRLEDEELISRNNDGSIVVSDPDLLLDSWREKYDFKKNRIIKGHIAARSSNEVLKKISDFLLDKDILHAATGLSGAWLYCKFAAFRIVSFYIEENQSRNLFKFLGFREEERGSNVWFVVPKDEGVFHGSKKVEGITCAHPVQVYLDLFGHPKRAMEAADDLRKKFLKWRCHRARLTQKTYRCAARCEKESLSAIREVGWAAPLLLNGSRRESMRRIWTLSSTSKKFADTDVRAHVPDETERICPLTFGQPPLMLTHDGSDPAVRAAA